MTTEIIKKTLKRHHITQAEVARRMGITPQSLHERIYVSSIACETIERIAEAIGISPSEFYEARYAEENERLRRLVAEQMRTIEILMNK